MDKRKDEKMKFNLDFYKGEDKYSDGDIEDIILNYTENYTEDKIDAVFKDDLRWPVFYHLTNIRKNIMNWYPMKKNASVLEIGAGMGAVTSTLCEKAERVVCVELSKRRATAIANRNKTRENLEIMVGNLNDMHFSEKFDYITLVGVLEYANLYTYTDNPYFDFLNSIKKYLKKDGKLLIAIENKFGMKYFAGAPEDHSCIRYDGIIGYPKKNRSAMTFGKKELQDLLCQVGLKYTKFYYPLPDYKLPNIIFSDEYLPDEKKIQDYEVYYYEGSKIEFDEKEAYKQAIKNGVFDIFANSFFVEACAKKIHTKVDLKNANLVKIAENEKEFYAKNKK